MRYKPTILISALIICFIIPVTVHSQGLDPDYAYIGLYGDYERTDWCYYFGGGSISTWLWVLPSERGAYEVSFDVDFPSNVNAQMGLINTSEILSYSGNEVSGWVVEFNECKYDWIWIFHYAVIINTNEITSTNIDFEGLSGILGAYNCNPTEPFEYDSFIVIRNILFNEPEGSPECIPVAVAPRSWGAIKSIFESE